MEIITTVEGMRDKRDQLAGSVGLVPTMGYLHQGHLSLVRRARQENAHVVVSNFVNPTQFGPGEDLSRYPRDLERDLGLLEKEKADIIYAPTVAEMYSPGYSTWVILEGVSEPLEGERRPCHFKGVATVVAKLFNAVRPTRAYFGRKDAQQLAVLTRMVRDLDMALEVVPCPTVREPDGLAMSSRNTYLNEAERQAATVLYRALQLDQRLWQAGERDPRRLQQAAANLISAEPLAGIDYVSVCDPIDFQALVSPADRALLALAVRIGKTRLIDNTLLGEETI
jgi:pantoate--beta-alanine ligase